MVRTPNIVLVGCQLFVTSAPGGRSWRFRPLQYNDGDGPRTITGVDNGNPISHDCYKGGSRSAFSGEAPAILQAMTTAGKITLWLASDTLDTLTGSSVDIVIVTP